MLRKSYCKVAWFGSTGGACSSVFVQSGGVSGGCGAVHQTGVSGRRSGVCERGRAGELSAGERAGGQRIRTGRPQTRSPSSEQSQTSSHTATPCTTERGGQEVCAQKPRYQNAQNDSLT